MEVLYFAAGKGHEGALLDLIKSEHCEDKQWEDIWYSPDTKLFVKPAEIKTRKRQIKEEMLEEDLKGYIDQLKSYCVCDYSMDGFIIILLLTSKVDDFTTKPELAVYHVEFEEWEIEQKRYYLLDMHTRLMDAMLTGDRNDIPYCEEWMCAKIKKTLSTTAMCLTCGIELTNRQVNSHLKKGCRGVTPAKYNEEIIPTCRWFEDCKPPYFRRINEQTTEGYVLNDARIELDDTTIEDNNEEA
jgi:hypothetical protein